jgi:hypothetical protein
VEVKGSGKNTLAYYDMATITAVKSFIVQTSRRNIFTKTLEKDFFQNLFLLFFKKIFEKKLFNL